MGCSPDYVAMGTHLLLPLDIIEATYLMPPPDSILSTEDLIVRRVIDCTAEETRRLERITF
jgi:hypothetical protein